MKKVIIVADDFGFSEGVNKGIVECWGKGVISAASLGVNFPSSSKAIDLAKDKKMTIGFHLNLTQGRPVLVGNKVKSLIDKKGNFLGKEKLLLSALLGRINSLELESEIKAQIDKFKEADLSPIFANSHQNVHLFPRVFDIFLNQVTNAGIKLIRNPIDAGLSDGRSFLVKPHRKILLYIFGKLAQKKLRNKKIIFPDVGYSFTLRRQFDLKDFVSYLKQLKGRFTEISFHPGYYEKHVLLKTYLTKQREDELQFLLQNDFKSAFKKADIQIANFNDLTKIENSEN